MSAVIYSLYSLKSVNGSELRHVKLRIYISRHCVTTGLKRLRRLNWNTSIYQILNFLSKKPIYNKDISLSWKAFANPNGVWHRSQLLGEARSKCGTNTENPYFLSNAIIFCNNDRKWKWMHLPRFHFFCALKIDIFAFKISFLNYFYKFSTSSNETVNRIVFFNSADLWCCFKCW